MDSSDQYGNHSGTGSPEITEDCYIGTTEINPEEQVNTIAEVGSTPLIGTMILSSADEQSEKSFNPRRIEKAVETLKKNEDIERRGF